MKKNMWLAAIIAAVLIHPEVAVAGTKTVKVKCDKGDSINEALENKAEELTIEISGFCREQVVITRGGVTLIGGDPTLDGITGPVPGEPVQRALVQVIDSFDVRLEKLTVTGGESRGLEARGPGVNRVVNCRVVGNQGRGIQAVDSAALVVEDTVITDNGYPSLIVFQADIFCTRCTVEGSIAAVRSGLVSVTDSTVSGSILSTQEATIGGQNTDVFASGVSLWALENAQIHWSGGEVEGSLLAELASQIFLSDVTQTSNPYGNMATDDSHFGVEGGTLLGDTRLSGFSDGTIEGGVTLGTLTCDRGGDAYCDGSETKTSSSCGLCP